MFQQHRCEVGCFIASGVCVRVCVFFFFFSIFYKEYVMTLNDQHGSALLFQRVSHICQSR